MLRFPKRVDKGTTKKPRTKPLPANPDEFCNTIGQKQISSNELFLAPENVRFGAGPYLPRLLRRPIAKAMPPARNCLIARQNGVLQQRINLRFPLLAGEHAVVADAGLHVMAFAVGADR